MSYSGELVSGHLPTDEDLQWGPALFGTFSGVRPRSSPILGDIIWHAPGRFCVHYQFARCR